MRKVTVGNFEEKNFLGSSQCFFKNIGIQLFNLSTNSHNFLLFLSCYPAELESVGIFKISLFVLRYVKTNFSKIILYLTEDFFSGFFGLNIL